MGSFRCIKKTLHIDEITLRDAKKACGAVTDTETVRLGLEALIRHAVPMRTRKTFQGAGQGCYLREGHTSSTAEALGGPMRIRPLPPLSVTRLSGRPPSIWLGWPANSESHTGRATPKKAVAVQRRDAIR